MCKKIFLLTMPNRTIYRLMVYRPGVEHTPRTLSIQKGIQRGSSKILKCRKKKLLDLQRRRRGRNIRKLTIPMTLLLIKTLLLIQKTYLPPMLRLKMVLNLKKMLKRMIHLRFEKKKHPTNVKSILEKISLQEDTGRNENHGYRNPCPFQVSPLKPKKKSTTTSFVSG